MAQIHVQAKRHPRANPTWMWAWIVIGILIIAAVVYFVYANKDNNTTNEQEIKNDRNTPVPGAVVPPQSQYATYVLSTIA